MKKLSIFLVSMAAVLGFTSCEQDRDPVYHAPTTFELNQPALQNQLIVLSEDGTFELVAKAQPDYGYSAVTQYGAIVSLTPDFTETREIQASTQSKMVFSSAKLAMAICELKGFESEEDYVDEDPIPVYFRGVAYLDGVESSRIVSSNYVSLNQVKYYYAVPSAGFIYLVGGPTGWNEPSAGNKAHYENWKLKEDDDNMGSKIYKGTFNIPAGEQYFRFYVELSGWGNDGELPSIGPNAVDGVNTPIEWVDGSFSGSAVPGKGSWVTPSDWEGGDITMVVNLSNAADYTVQFIIGSVTVVDPSYLYMVGNQSNWAEPSEANADVYSNWRLVDNTGSGVYYGTFELPADMDPADLYCRFYDSLPGWNGTAKYAASSADENIDVTLGTPATTTAGPGNFLLHNAAGTTITVTLDTNANTVVFE